MTTEVVQTTSGPAASQRPTAPITIGGKTYDALCPKMAVWVTAVHRVNAAISQSGGNTMNAAAQLHDVLVGDERDPHSTGILVQALEPEDIAHLDARLKDRRDDLDMPELWFAAIELMRTFEDWVQEQGKALGLSIPKLAKRPQDRKAPAARKR